MTTRRRTVLRRSAAAFASLLLAQGAIGAVSAEEGYPDRPVELIVTFGPGGGADTMARTLAKIAEPMLGVPIAVSNVAGASGNAGLTKLLTQPADGYTLGTLIALTVASWASELGTAKPDDFTVVAWAQNSESMLFVPKDSPFRDFPSLLEHVKANPDTVRVATSGYGTMDDLTLKFMASKGYPTVNVPFAKPAERYASAVGGHVDALYEEPGDVRQFLESGDLIPIVVFAEKRLPDFPDVPTAAEYGIELWGLDNFRTLAVRADTPPDRIAKLSQVLNAALDTEEWKAFCAQTYSCVREKKTPEQATAAVRDFYDKIVEFQKQFTQ